MFFFNSRLRNPTCRLKNLPKRISMSKTVGCWKVHESAGKDCQKDMCRGRTGINQLP